MEPVLDKQKQAQKQRVEPPKNYHVVVMNDDFSTVELVVEVLTTFFGKTAENALQIATDVHSKGQGLAGTYTKDIAETKVNTANEFCQLSGMPLHLTIKSE